MNTVFIFVLTGTGQHPRKTADKLRENKKRKGNEIYC